MRAFLGRLLDVRAGEGPLALLGAVVFLLVQGGQAFALNGADALLFERFGVEALPFLYLALGASTLVATTAYAAVLGRADRGRVSTRLLAALAAVGAVAWAAALASSPPLYPIVWLVVALASAILGTLVWVIAGEVCDPRQAKRLFNLFASAGILGTVLAGFLTGPAARALGTESLLLLFAAVAMAASVVAGGLIARYARRPTRAGRPASPIQELRLAHRVVWSNPTMRLTAVGAVVFSILFFSVSFPFNVEVAASFPDGAELAGFLGVFSGVVTAATFVVSLLIASRVFARIGVIRALFLLPLVYLFGFLLWTIRLDLITAAVFRFGQLVVIGGLASTAYGALFNVIPADRRSQVRAYQAGPPAQLGVMLSGVLILLGQQGLTPTQALGIGIFFSVVGAGLVWRMRRSYAASLVDALRQGVVEVFTGTETRFEALRQDSQARQVALRGLRDDRPEVRQISVRILETLRAREAIDPLADLHGDSAPAVRLAAVKALARLDPTAESALAPFLGDPDPGVRAEAVTGAAAAGVLTHERQASLLADPDPGVRARAAIAASTGLLRPRAMEVVEALLGHPSVEARLAGLHACAEIDGMDASGTLITTLNGGPRALRLAAAEALARRPTAAGTAALIAALADGDAQVRRGAAQALRTIDGAEADLIAVLDAGSPQAQDEAVAALAGRGAASEAALLRWAADRVPEAEAAREWRRALEGLPAVPVVRSLTDLLTRYEWQVAQRILRALAAAGAGPSIRVIARGLRARDPDLRSQAIEALDSIGDRRVTAGLIRLLEPETALASPPPGEAALAELARHPRPWFRALALRARAELIRSEWQAVREAANADAAAIVREAVGADGASGMGGTMIETSSTLGVVERVLFLREVPIFRLLEPEDLERIAGLAREQLYGEREWLCREGDVGDELFVLVDGSVEVSKAGPSGERPLRTLQAGEHLGELAILREQPRSASVRAVSPVRTLVLGGEALRSILEERPVVGLGMLESLAERLSTLG